MSQTKSSIPSIYNPSNLTKDEITGSFVIRKKEFQRIYDAIRQDDMSKPGQHFVIQGQRGAGKTTLLLMLKYTVKDDKELNKWLIPVMFNEEQFNITKLYKLWESIARYLEYEEEGNNQFRGLEDEMKSHLEAEEYEQICFDILNNALEKNGKKLLLLIDNFGDMVSKFKTKERQRLREILTANNNFKIVGGTAVTLLFQANYSHPFFEFFKIISLESLTKEETIELLRKFGELNNDADKINKLLTEKPEHVEALRLLTGGVPRTIALLYEIFIDNENGEAFKDLEILIDRITPLYTIKLNDLPPPQQEIIDSLALNWDAMTVKEIAAQTRIKSKEISVHINRMVKDNIVNKIDTTTKNYLYNIQERFLNIWYLMRYGNKKSENRVKWLTQFLECWLNEEEIVGFGEKLKSVMQTGNPYAKYALYMTSAIAETKAYASQKDVLIEEAKTYLLKADPALVCELPKTDNDLLDDAIKYVENERYEVAINNLTKMTNKKEGLNFVFGLLYELDKNLITAITYYKYSIDEGDSRAMNNLAMLYENEFKDFKNAEKYYLMAVKIENVEAMFNLALLYENNYKDYKNAEKYYLMAADKGHSGAMFNLALLYDNYYKNYKNAEKYYLMAADKENSSAMYNLALIYKNEFKDFRKAKKYYLMAINKEHTGAMFNLALLYESEFKDYKNAEKYYLMAVDKGHSSAMFNLALLFKNEFKDYIKAEKYYLMAVDNDDPVAMFNLALLYKNEFQNIKKSIEMFENSSKEGHIKSKINLSFIYFNEERNKDKYIALANELSDNESAKKEYDILIDIINVYSFLWDNKTEKALDLINKTDVKFLLLGSDNNNLAYELLLLLLAKKQYHYVHKLFNENNLNLKDKLKPIYYAVLFLLKDEFPDEYKKMGSELKPVVDDILKKIKEMEVKYA